MISVIVPTMWKFPPFASFLSCVCDHELISDVIVIDNDRHQRPYSELWNHPKITILDYGENIFVNPAWNAGAYHAKSKILCFMNDDIIYDLRVYKRIIDHPADWGMIGLLMEKRELAIDLYMEPWNHQFPGGIGRLFFIQKTHWVDIPPGMLISYGDFFLWRIQAKYKQNWFMRNLLYWTPDSTTSKHFAHYYGWDTHQWISISNLFEIPD